MDKRKTMLRQRAAEKEDEDAEEEEEEERDRQRDRERESRVTLAWDRRQQNTLTNKTGGVDDTRTSPSHKIEGRSMTRDVYCNYV